MYGPPCIHAESFPEAGLNPAANLGPKSIEIRSTRHSHCPCSQPDAAIVFPVLGRHHHESHQMYSSCQVELGDQLEKLVYYEYYQNFESIPYDSNISVTNPDI